MRHHTTMRIESKKIRLAVVAFVCGFMFCAVLVLVSQRTPPVITSGPTLASSQIAAPFLNLFPVRFEIRSQDMLNMPMTGEKNGYSDDLRELPGQRPRSGLDLIDTRPLHIDAKDFQ